MIISEVRVALCHGRRLVSEQVLHRVEVNAVTHTGAGKDMATPVQDAEIFWQARLFLDRPPY